MDQRIRARYRLETALPPAQAAEAIAGEQSTGTFTRIPGETDELRERHGARVESVFETGPSGSEVEISWPLSNMGPSLPNLLAAVSGNLWEMKQFTKLHLLDLQLPPAFLDRYCGPQFGWRYMFCVFSLAGLVDRQPVQEGDRRERMCSPDSA
jgi:ribulose-bisphosphate carboxylase large chain